MIIAFTGAQSTGKSTLLAELQKDEAFKDWKFEPEITRSLKERYGVDINENGDDATQIVTVYSHLDNFLRHKNSNAVFDRCVIDGFLYTVYAYSKGKISEYVKEYACGVHDMLINKYDIIFYTEADIPLVNDGVRSDSVVFRETMVKIFEEYLASFPNKNVVRLKGSVEERLKIIRDEIEKRKVNNTITQ